MVVEIMHGWVDDGWKESVVEGQKYDGWRVVEMMGGWRMRWSWGGWTSDGRMDGWL